MRKATINSIFTLPKYLIIKYLPIFEANSLRYFFLLVSLILMNFNLFAQQEKVQSGIVYYFTRYIEWPAEKSSGDFVIATLGADAMVSHLETMASAKTVGSQKIVVKNVSSVNDASDAHILILGDKNLFDLSKALGLSKARNVLVVTDESGYAKKGSGINFIVKNGKPSYEINMTSIERAGLKVSSKLTALGTVIN